MLAIFFTVIFGYFYTYTSVMKISGLNIEQTSQEKFVLTGALGTSGNVSAYVNNTGSIAIQIVVVLVSNSSGQVIKVINSSGGSNPRLPISLNPGQSSPLIDTGVPSKQTAPGSYLIKVITQRGNTQIALWPQPQSTSDLAFQAISSGAIGDLYLQFNSYKYYTITSHGSISNCPGSSTNSTYSNYCLQTSAGYSGVAFDIPASVVSNSGDGIAFSINMTNLNSQKVDIILDQFTLMFQNAFYGNNHQNFVSWYIATVGATSNGYIPILKNYQLQVLPYDVPKTLYFISSGCVTASNGPTSENSNCASSSNFESPLGHGTASTVFLLSNGWEEASGSYQATQGYSNSLVYSGTGIDVNYGQNSPYVSTLYE